MIIEYILFVHIITIVSNQTNNIYLKSYFPFHINE